jgi:hypothetical protein
LEKHVEGVRAVLILFLGLNISWMETSYNAAVMKGSDTMLGWLPLNWYMTAGEWFWTHLVLTILTIAAVLYSFYIVPPRRGENLQC